MPRNRFAEDLEIAFQYVYAHDLIAQVPKENRRINDDAPATVSRRAYSRNTDVLRMCVWNWIRQPVTSWMKVRGYPDPHDSLDSATNAREPLPADKIEEPVEEAVAATSSWAEEYGRLLVVKASIRRIWGLLKSMTTISPEMCQLVEIFIENLEKVAFPKTVPPKRRTVHKTNRDGH